MSTYSFSKLLIVYLVYLNIYHFLNILWKKLASLENEKFWKEIIYFISLIMISILLYFALEENYIYELSNKKAFFTTILYFITFLLFPVFKCLINKEGLYNIICSIGISGLILGMTSASFFIVTLFVNKILYETTSVSLLNTFLGSSIAFLIAIWGLLGTVAAIIWAGKDWIGKLTPSKEEKSIHIGAEILTFKAILTIGLITIVIIFWVFFPAVEKLNFLE